MTSRKRRRATPTPIEIANELSDAEFVAQYLEPGSPTGSTWETKWTHPTTQEEYSISCHQASQLSKTDYDDCFALIEDTSRKDYEKSTKRWNPNDKRKEMRSAGLRYLVVKNQAGRMRGFTSLMPTYEEGQPVAYCYEIHLRPELRGTGLGAALLGFIEIVAYNLLPISKVMLTCFVSNAGALGFYRRLGFEKDDISPGPRKLRGGVVYEPDYVILSKRVRRRGDKKNKTKKQATAAGRDSDGWSTASEADELR